MVKHASATGALERTPPVAQARFCPCLMHVRLLQIHMAASSDCFLSSIPFAHTFPTTIHNILGNRLPIAEGIHWRHIAYNILRYFYRDSF